MPYSLPNVGGDPVSGKVAAALLEEIRRGRFAGAEVLPSENELARQYGVSRSVIRDALSTLERAGFLRRGRGIGTQIRREVVALPSRLDLKIEYSELIRARGQEPGVDSLSVYTEPAGEALAARLEIDAGEPVVVCEKRLLAGKRPVIYSIDRLPLRIFGDLPFASLDFRQSVFDLLEAHLGFTVDANIAQVAAIVGPRAIRDLLAVKEDEAMLFIDEIGYYRLSRPILHAYGYYTNFFDFTLLRKRF